MLLQVLQQIQDDKVNTLVVVPLYPQFSVSTSGSSLKVRCCLTFCHKILSFVVYFDLMALAWIEYDVTWARGSFFVGTPAIYLLFSVVLLASITIFH